MQWSPLGTYLVTLHKQGAAVWGGADTFTRLMRYQHNMVRLSFRLLCSGYVYFSVGVKFDFLLLISQVKLVDFSPGEKYLVTYHSQEPSNPRDASVSETLLLFFLTLFYVIFCQRF